MSYLGGFYRLRFDDGGSQGMVRGEDSIGSRKGKGDPPLTSSEDIPSRVNSVGVITWLKPVREP